ncbi:MAG: hypothetical protein LBU65_07805 [Planctomycetaceae bacterium]|jgi:hypothetical protein|nr:hypothetical protein [Planctomycetaceae bacterium]
MKTGIFLPTKVVRILYTEITTLKIPVVVCADAPSSGDTQFLIQHWISFTRQAGWSRKITNPSEDGFIITDVL